MKSAPDASGSRLNSAQQAAVAHGTGPVLVLAGAGSGKTRVIIARLARLIGEGVPSKQLLAVTFTNKAAKQMRARLAATVGAAQASQVCLSTFHALGLSILQAEHEAAGLHKDFVIYDTADLLSLVRELCRTTKVADRRLDCKQLLALLQSTKRAGRSEVELRWGDDYELAAYDLYPAYMAQMRALGAIDFDDLILRSAAVLHAPEVAARWRTRFAHVLVDEYQDTSPDQLELVRRLVPEGGNLCAVGDDDQAIYSWRGAATDTIAAFYRAYPSTKQIVLTENYRSSGHILAAANCLIAHNSARSGKVLASTRGDGVPVEIVELPSCEAEAAFVAEQCHVLLGRGARARDIAILYRANSQAIELEQTLASERLTTQVAGGQSLFERKESRDVFAMLAALCSRRNEMALRRIINVPARGLGPASVEHLLAFSQSRNVPLRTALELAGQGQVGPLGRAAEQGARLLAEALLRAERAMSAAPKRRLGELARTLVDELGLAAAIERADDSDTTRRRRLDNLAYALGAIERFAEREGKIPGAEDNALHSLRLFLRSQALEGRLEDAAEEAEAVHLMTIHAAKGLEFPYVFVVGLEEDLLPHRRALEDLSAGAEDSIGEERRLCYVAMTRAEQRLWLCHAKSRQKHGRLVPRTPSRFLAELPIDVVRRTSAAAEASSPADYEATRAAFFLRMRKELGIEA